MANNTPDLEQEVAAIIAAGFTGEQPPKDAAPQEQTERKEKHYLDVDLYRLPNGGVLLLPNNQDAAAILDTNVVETHLISPEQIQSEQEQADTPQPEPAGAVPQPQQKTRKVKPSYILAPLLLLLILTVGTLSYLFLLPLTATAAITITPLVRTLHTHASLTIATNPTNGQVKGRAMQSVSLTKSQTIAATGHGHQDATSATGEITFYNTDLSPVSIPAGETFTVNGIAIVIDTPVTIGAATPPIEAQASTYAHAVQTGASGNIPAKAIYTKCCTAQVYATNLLAFTGGQDARDYSYVQSSDLHNGQDNLVAILTPQATAALTKQLHSGEQLVPPVCSSHTTSSKQPGEEAVSVTVSVTQTCASVSYSLDSLQQVATSFLAHSQPLTTYQQAGTIQVTVKSATYEHNTARLTVTLSGIWVYRFSQNELDHLKHMIAGASREQAQAIMKRQPGVQGVSIALHRLDLRDQLPNDPTSITMQFVYLVS